MLSIIRCQDLTTTLISLHNLDLDESQTELGYKIQNTTTMLDLMIFLKNRFGQDKKINFYSNKINLFKGDMNTYVVEFINQQKNIRKIYYQINNNDQTILSSINAPYLQSQIDQEYLQLQQENDSLQSKCNNLQIFIQQLESTQDQLQNKYEELKTKYEVQINQNLELKKVVEILENLNRQNNDKNDFIIKLQNENQLLKQQNEDKDKEVNKQKESQKQLLSFIEKYKKEKLKLEKQVEQLQSLTNSTSLNNKNISEIKTQDSQIQNRHLDENQIKKSQQINQEQFRETSQQIKQEQFRETSQNLQIQQQQKQKPKIQEVEQKDEYETSCGHKISNQQIESEKNRANQFKKIPKCQICQKPIEWDVIFKKKETIEQVQEESSDQKLEDRKQIKNY